MNGGAVLLAGDRQLQTGKYIGALFLVVWGGLFGGIPLVLLFTSVQASGPKAFLVLFPLIGLPAFFLGLYLALRREEVWFDPLRDSVDIRRSFLHSATVTPNPRRQFDRVYLRVEIGKEDRRDYRIVLTGVAGHELNLGTFGERDDALVAGMRAARRAGLAFEEKQEGAPLLRLEAAELQAVPAATLPQDETWWRRAAPLALVLANLVPAWGVLYAGWHVLSVMLLFWMENVIVGAYTLLKMLLARGGAAEPVETILRMAGNLFSGAFFTVHYGMFCLVHGIFVVAMFGEKDAMRGFRGDLSTFPHFVLGLAKEHGLLLAFVALAVSHGISFYVHYLKPRAYLEADARKIMAEPYKRVVILHVVILVGGGIAQASGSGILALLLLIGLKTVVDLASHRSEHAMPHEREMRDFMEEHGHRYLSAEPPVPAASVAPGSAVPSGAALAHYLGAWAAAPDAMVPAGWIRRVEFRDEAGRVKARLWNQSDAPTGDFDALVRGSGSHVGFIDVRTRAEGVMRIARFTGSAAGADRLDLNEIQHPEGKPDEMQARSLVLRRQKS